MTKRINLPQTLLPHRLVAEKYGVSTRTIDRWGEDPTLSFPPVILIRKRKYYDAATIDAWDRARALQSTGRAS
jgi:hypothetical protein